MKDIFPQVRNKLASDAYFATLPGQFKNTDGVIKIYDEDDAPSFEYPFLSIEIRYGQKDRHTDWVKPFITFNATGPSEIDEDKEYYGKETLMEILENCERIFRESNCIPALDGRPIITYEVIGDSEYDNGNDPIIEMVTQSMALRVGFVSMS